MKKQRPPDRQKAALWAFCVSLVSFPHRFIKSRDRASPWPLAAFCPLSASCQQVKRPPWALFAPHIFARAIARELHVFLHESHVLRVFNHKKGHFRAFSGIKFNFSDRMSRTHFSGLLSSCKQLPDHFRHVTKKVCAMSSWRHANVCLLI